MKNTYRLHLTVATFSVVFLAASGCREKKPQEIQVQLPEKSMPAVPAAADTPSAPAAPVPAGPAVTDFTLTSWSDIKDDTYENRAHFQAGLKQLIAKVAVQIAELNDKRATMKGTTSTADWDFAMKGMTLAQSYLAAMEDEVNKATPETWDQKKDKVGAAWTRTQDAYDKVKRSTTN